MDWLAPDAELLVAELVTNAVTATTVRQEEAVRLRLSSDGARVLIEVWDADPRPPAATDGRPEPRGETGHGLFLVPALSAGWDWYLTHEPVGKVVRCEMQVLLTPRAQREQERRPVEAMRDPDVLRRVRDRLRELA